MFDVINKFRIHRPISNLIVGLISIILLFTVANISANASSVSDPNSVNNSSTPNVTNTKAPSNNRKRIPNKENLNNTTSTVPKQFIVNNKDYGFYYNMDPIYNNERTIRGNTSVTFSHPMYLHYAHYTHYKFGRAFGDPQSMAILPDGRMYILFNAGHSDSPLNRILEYNIKNKKLMHVGAIFHAGHGQGLSYDYSTHKLLLCINQFIPNHHGILKGNLIISHVGKQTLKPYGKLINIKPPKNRWLGDDFTSDNKGNLYNVARYGNWEPYSPYGGLLIYRGNPKRIRLNKLLFHSPNSTVQNIEFNPLTNRIYIVGNNCITSFPVNKLNHLKSKDINVSIFDNPVEFESLGFYRKRAYLLLNRPSRILVSNKVF